MEPHTKRQVAAVSTTFTLSLITYVIKTAAAVVAQTTPKANGMLASKILEVILAWQGSFGINNMDSGVARSVIKKALTTTSSPTSSESAAISGGT